MGFSGVRGLRAVGEVVVGVGMGGEGFRLVWRR